jgi:hypothetical protein
VAKNILHMLSSMKHMSPFDVNMALEELVSLAVAILRPQGNRNSLGAFDRS